MKNWFGKFPQVLASSGKKHRILKYPILLLSLFMTALCRGIDAAGTLARPAIRRRMLAAAISACMVITMLPLQAFATEPTQNAGSLCEHHPAHTAECGYTEGMAETPCTHDHTEDCYQEVTDCIHEHMAECYTENDSVSDNNATPSDAEEKEPAECTHICDEDTGCITQELDCTHERGEHDDTCGYTKETEGMPCAYVCEICYPAEKDTEIRLMEANEPTVTASGRDWELDGSGNLTISTADGMADWVLNGLRENKDSIKTAIIVEAVTDIPGSAFYQCTSLTNVTAPAVKTIRSDAFNRCKALTGASFPVAESIGSSAFYKCTSLTDVTAPAVKTIGNGAFYSCTALTGASFPVATNIGVMAFGSCKALTSASFPVATYISSAAFSECAALTSIDFPNAVNIESNAFSECKALTSIDFPAVETIDGYALYNCSALTNANFPTVKTIGSNALYNCSGLATLSLPAAPPSVTDVYAFSKCPPTRSLIFVDTTGTALTGNALTSAQAAYKAVDDSRMSGEAANNNTWYGWRIENITVTSVEVTPNTANVQKGKTQQFTATVTGTNSPAQTVTWNVSAGNAGTTISTDGLLTVASDETAASLAVTATSTVDITRSGSATATVTSTPVTKYTITLDANGGNVSFASATTGTDGKLTSLPTPSRSGSYRFDGWFTAASGGTQVTTGTVFMSNDTIFAHWTYTGGSSSDTGGGSSGGDSSSGSSGGGGSSGTTPTPSTPDTDVPKTGQSTVTAAVDSNGNATVTVTDKAVTDAIKAAKDAARKDNLQGRMITVEIVAQTDKVATQVTATLPKTVQDTLISNKVDAVKITTGTVTMSFSQTAIQQINGQAKADVTITAAKSDTSKLTGDAKALIGSRPMFDFNATYDSGKKITEFGGNTVSIAIPYTLGKGEVPGNLYAIYVDGNGKATKITNSSYDADRQAVIFTASHFSQYGIGYQASYNFTDISNHWAKTDIEFVTNRGLLSGTSNTIFSPNESMTRAMFVTALGRLAGIDTNSYKTGKFTDVKADVYYAPFVNWAASKGIISGTSATTFSPDQTVTRQEVALIMANYAKTTGYPVPITRTAVTFADNASIGSWAAEAVKSMQMAGVIMGKDSNKFEPTGTATRAEVSAVLRRYMELVIDRTTAQGLDVNDSGNIVYYENGKLSAEQ